MWAFRGDVNKRDDKKPAGDCEGNDNSEPWPHQNHGHAWSRSPAPTKRAMLFPSLLFKVDKWVLGC